MYFLGCFRPKILQKEAEKERLTGRKEGKEGGRFELVDG